MADSTACDDADACTQTDACQAGVCAGASPVMCAALDACHAVGACDPATGACSNPGQPDGFACSDGDACTQTDTCLSAVCTGNNPVVCAGGEVCDGGACVPVCTPQFSGPPLATGPGPVSVQGMDLNGDTMPDLVTSNSLSDTWT